MRASVHQKKRRNEDRVRRCRLGTFPCAAKALIVASKHSKEVVMGGNIELTGPDLVEGVELNELPERKPFVGHARGEPIVLVRDGAQISALGGACTHYGAPLGDGLVVGDTLRCPWHHACFNLRTGEATGAPALDAIPCYSVQLKDGRITVGEKIAPPTKTAPSNSPNSVVLVGAGAASAAAAVALRQSGYQGSVVMVGDEPPSPIDRTNLSKDYLAGNAPEEWVPIRSLEYWQERNIAVEIGDPAVSLDTKQKKLTLQSGRVLSYGALLLATGAEAKRLPIAGASLPHVFTLRSLPDSRAIIAAATKAKRAVIIGMSFIGLEVAASLRARGVEVNIVGRDAVPLGRILGEELGRFIRALHEEHGVRFFTQLSPKAIHADSVELSDGQKLSADLVVMGVGVSPRTSLAEGAGLTIEDGVVVDELLRTSAPDVYAAGDIARYPEARLGQRVRVEHWVAAQRQGQAAARAMLGQGQPFRDVPFFWSQHYDVSLSYVGHATSWDTLEVLGKLSERDAAIVYRSAGRVLAVATLGRDRQSLAIEAAMESGDDSALEKALAE
jgi:NADPH-dependent 2,4-dienoyl-CoA reductase/sulfur reductase-like enzyme/nitrite reductase/ring-hydroxylating ferredoxin subunit